MPTNTPESIEMANRLKELRKERNLSHIKLSEALREKYNISISKDSLIAYEVTSAMHDKACANQGMRAEYLRCLADFYGVSTDYILGITPSRSSAPEIRTAIECTGLTEENIVFLNNPSVAMGRGATVPKVNSLVHAFINDVIDTCREEGLHNEFQIMQQILTRVNGLISPEAGEDLPSFDAVDEYIRRNGLFLLRAKDGAAYYARQIGDTIAQGFKEKYIHPSLRYGGYIDD